jgi:TPR repeat protein
MEYYTRAAEKQYVESMYHAALMHLYGRSGTLAYPQALALLEAGEKALY